MVKIEVNVVESKKEICTVTLKQPKQLKSATNAEKITANVLANAFNETINKLQ